MEQLRTVRLLGAAGRKFGREFQIAVKSPAEAFRALCSICPGLRAWTLEQHEKGVAWRVLTDDRKGVSEDRLKVETSTDVITFAPTMRGAGGDSGVFQIILGVALIAASLIITFGTAGGGLALGLLGGSLVLGGVAQLITPTPQLPSQAKTGEQSPTEELNSALFTRAGGNAAQGECVPVLYGRRLVPAPRLISFDLRLLPASRNVNTAGTQGLLGYVNRVDL